MDEFKVKVGQVRNVVSQQQKMAGELDSVRDELYTVRNNLRFKISQRERIDRRLTQQGQALNVERNKMNRLSSTLSGIADMYERTESELSGRDVTNGPSGSETIFERIAIPIWWPLIPFTPFIPYDWPRILWDDIKLFPLRTSTVDIKFGTGLITDNAKSFVDKIFDDAKDDSDWFKDKKDKISDWEDRHSKDLHKSKGVYDTKDGTYKDVDLNDKNAVKDFDDNLKKSKMETDIKLASIGGSTSAAAWSGNIMDGDADGTHKSAKVSFLEAEAHAEAYMGLYQTDPVTGKKTFKPGMGGSIGTSFSLFTAEEEAQLGNDMLGVYAKSTQTVGRVGAEAEGSVGLYDAEGNFNPSAYAGLSAEAIAGEITGSVGAKVLGTDVGVSGSLNYGIGAHANVGFKDGKFSLDVGATLGVGASVKLEIDVSGTVDAICDGAKAAWEGFTGWFK